MNALFVLSRCLLLVLASTSAVLVGAESATVKGDRLNVRGRPSLVGEVVTQLHKGEPVTILEEVKGVSNAWAKVLMPTNTPVWINATHLDPATKTVSVRRLNVRAGAGEDYSVLGLLEKGAQVREIRTVGDWMEIETPPGTYGYVAAEFLDKSGVASIPVSAPSSAPAASPAPLPTKIVSEPPPADPAPAKLPVAVAPSPEPVPTPTSKPDSLPPTSAPAPVPVVSTPPQAAPTAGQDEPLPKRIVTREGFVKRTLSIQAPTEYQLVSVENGRTLNYLHTVKLGFSLKEFTGRKISVTGEELIDKRWPSTPVLDVETLRIVP